MIALESRLSTTCAIRCGVDEQLEALGRLELEVDARAAPAVGVAATRRVADDLRQVGAASRTTWSGPSSTWAVCSRSATSRWSRSVLRATTSSWLEHVRGQVLALPQQADVADDRGQRGAQLVGDRGDELVLDPQRPHEVGDVLVGQRGAGEPALARRAPPARRPRAPGG